MTILVRIVAGQALIEAGSEVSRGADDVVGDLGAGQSGVIRAELSGEQVRDRASDQVRVDLLGGQLVPVTPPRPAPRAPTTTATAAGRDDQADPPRGHD